jgi:hypothetical protein
MGKLGVFIFPSQFKNMFPCFGEFNNWKHFWIDYDSQNLHLVLKDEIPQWQ